MYNKEVDLEAKLEYLRGVHSKYSYYLKQYFGFTVKEMADYIGISSQFLIMIIKGKRKMRDEYAQKFLEAFDHFDIRNKTQNFEETPEQKSIRNLLQKVKSAERP